MDSPHLRNRYSHVSWDTGGSDHPHKGFPALSVNPCQRVDIQHKMFITVLTRRFTVIAGGNGVT